MSALVWEYHTWRNRLQTVALVGVLFAVAGLVGLIAFGTMGMLIALSMMAVMMLIEPLVGYRLTMRLYKARPIRYEEAPQLWQALKVLSARGGLPVMPDLYYAPSAVINAFAVGGSKDAAIVLNDGLLRVLSFRELTAVMAHECAHIAHGDLRVMGLADFASRLATAGALAGYLMVLLALPWLWEGSAEISWFSLFLLIVSPWLAQLAQFGLSRVREFDADLAAARLTGDPLGLASALAKIERIGRGWRSWVIPGWGNPDPSWLRSHPSTEERVCRLQELHLANPISTSDERAWQCSIPRQTTVPRWRLGGFW